MNLSQVVGRLHTLFSKTPNSIRGIVRMRRRLWFLSAGVGFLILNGCAPAFPPETVEPPPPVYRFADVPIPPDFVRDSTESFVFETPTLKAGIVVYRGGASVDSVVEFFKAEMPQHGWVLINSFEHQEVRLNFEKPGWSCTIRVDRRNLKTMAEIVIGPKADPGPELGLLPEEQQPGFGGPEDL